MTMDPNPPATAATARERVQRDTLKRRRRRVIRSSLTVVVITAVLILLSVINRNRQAIDGCRERMQAAATLLEEQYQRGDLRPGRLSLAHVKGDPAQERRLERWRNHVILNYRFSELASASREVGVCCCKRPHDRLFGPRGRHVMIFSVEKGAFTVRWFEEAALQARSDELGLYLDVMP